MGLTKSGIGMLLAAALMLPASAALAGAPTNVSDRLDDVWDCDQDNLGLNLMQIVALGTDLGASGSCEDAAGSGIVISWLTQSPNKAQADSKKVKVDQKSFATVTFFVPDSASGSGSDETGTAIVQKCKARGDFKAKKFDGKGKVNCKLGQSLGTTPALSAEAIAAVLLAFEKKSINKKDCKIGNNGKLNIKHKSKATCIAQSVP